jgi:hypothetical protein
MMDEWKARPDRSADGPLQYLRFGEQLERQTLGGVQS